MSSPSPGKRRMDTDVMKLYEKHEVNLRPKPHVFSHESSHDYRNVFLDFIVKGKWKILGRKAVFT